MDRITKVEQNYPAANHYVLVLGDKDYRLNVERLLKAGKFVHIVSRDEALARTYRAYAVRYPEQMSAVSLEELLEGDAVGERAA